MNDQPAARKPLATWKVVVLSVAAAFLVFGGTVAYLRVGSTPRRTPGERAVQSACEAAVRAKLSDANRVTFQGSPAISLEAGTDDDGKFSASDQVDYYRAGEPDRTYYFCDVRRAGGGATVTSLTGV